jgi:hypothetical protein
MPVRRELYLYRRALSRLGNALYRIQPTHPASRGVGSIVSESASRRSVKHVSVCSECVFCAARCEIGPLRQRNRVADPPFPGLFSLALCGVSCHVLATARHVHTGNSTPIRDRIIWAPRLWLTCLRYVRAPCGSVCGYCRARFAVTSGVKSDFRNPPQASTQT